MSVSAAYIIFTMPSISCNLIPVFLRVTLCLCSSTHSLFSNSTGSWSVFSLRLSLYIPSSGLLSLGAMLLYFVAFLACTSVVNSLTLPRNPTAKRGVASDPPFQKIPTGAVPAIKFDPTAKTLKGLPPYVHTNPPAEYQARSIDVPFGRLFHGKMKFFSAGQFNLPGSATSVWGKGKRDNTNQSACGIPDDAYFQSKVAIHPYFLKYAGLERYCMQDVCISFWNEDPRPGHQSDMMLKVTDICTTDPKDPTHCATPQDIKIDRVKAQIMEHMTGPLWSTFPQLSGDEFKGNGTWWFFTKCFADVSTMTISPFLFSLPFLLLRDGI